VNDICTVHLSKQALKGLKKAPVHVALKLHAWIDEVINCGLNETRKIVGYHDELLKGSRVGQRSIRLNRAYRAIYIEESNNNIRFVEIIEVMKHEY
jgi:proteic killer suppression protein